MSSLSFARLTRWIRNVSIVPAAALPFYNQHFHSARYFSAPLHVLGAAFYFLPRSIGVLLVALAWAARTTAGGSRAYEA